MEEKGFQKNSETVWLPMLRYYSGYNIQRGSVFKTDKSKRKGVCFWQEQKLQPDRPHPDQEVVLRKTDLINLHTW